jgi:CRISP-associated protein Cas1
MIEVGFSIISGTVFRHTSKEMIPWRIIAGYGSHIKATRDTLSIQHKGRIEEIAIADIDHLLIIGGHTIQTSAINTLIRSGVFISLFTSDGEHTGIIEPYGYRARTEIEKLQGTMTAYTYALQLARASVKSRLLMIEEWNEQSPHTMLFSGELELLKNASDELEHVVKIEEIRRIDRLITDMYYEIMSRIINPSYGFKRRTERPYQDPVNALLSLGYAALSGVCTRSLLGAHLNPDLGVIRQGKRSLALDLIHCWKAKIVDQPVIRFIQDGFLTPERYEITPSRCILSDDLMQKMTLSMQQTIDQRIIDYQVITFLQALRGERAFDVIKV